MLRDAISIWSRIPQGVTHTAWKSCVVVQPKVQGVQMYGQYKIKIDKQVTKIMDINASQHIDE